MICCKRNYWWAIAAAIAIASAVSSKGASFTAEVSGIGRPMILIPGLSSPASVWDGTAAHFGDRYQIHKLQLAGFAGAKPIDGAFLPTVRTELAQYIRDNKLSSPIVVGHSLGAFLAFWLASSEPDLVGAVVAVDGLPFAPAAMGGKPPDEAIDNMVQFIASQTPEQFAMQTRMSMSRMIGGKENLERFGGLAAKSDPKTVARAMKELMTTDLRGDVAKIKAPVLLIAAGDEQTAEYAKQIESIKRHELVVAKDSKHFVMLDAPDFLYAAMEKFLQ
ncbi:MAG TPA: alpha/beta hydrolase [Thermoanaerobaculia bacterium]